MTEPTKPITIRITESQKRELEQLAWELGFIYSEKPSLSLLVQAIGDRVLFLEREWSEQQLKALLEGLRYVPVRMAEEILLRPSVGAQRVPDLSAQVLGKPTNAVEEQLFELMLQKQPFRFLQYKDISGQVHEFNVRYADWWRGSDGKFRLRCWCEEGQEAGNGDLSELAHNWCFVLGRNQQVEFVPIGGSWREQGLDWIEAKLFFLGGMAYAYPSSSAPRLGDEDLGLQDWQGQTVRAVSRSVWSSFWLFKDLSRYIDVVAIASPSGLRKKWLLKLQELLDLNKFLELESRNGAKD